MTKKHSFYLTLSSALITANYYLYYILKQNYLIKDKLAATYLWHLPEYLYFCLFILLIIVNITLNKLQENLPSIFIFSKIFYLTPLYAYLLLNLNLKHMLINLSQSTHADLVDQSICFGFLLFSLTSLLLTITSYGLGIAYICKKKNPT